MHKDKHFLELLVSHEDWQKLWDITPAGRSMAEVAEEALHNFIAAQHGVQRTAETCAICGEVESLHHPEDGGHEFRR